MHGSSTHRLDTRLVTHATYASADTDIDADIDTDTDTPLVCILVCVARENAE